MKILLTGKTGQVGYELERSLQGLGQVMAVDRTQMDLANLVQVRDVIRTLKPDLIVNAAAYTAVDRAENDAELAMRINADAPGVMAEEARRLGAVMIHYSSDYVFDGKKTTPYLETDLACPINVYGATKFAGEQAIQAAGVPHLILRTSWVYGMRGKNFLLTMLRLARERDELRVVADQFGAPTWSRTVADTTAYIILQSKAKHSAQDWLQQLSGTYHLTAQGRTTWYGFAREIFDNVTLVKKPVLLPVVSKNYILPAKRPTNSSLSCDRLIKTFCELPKWNESLVLCLG